MWFREFTIFSVIAISSVGLTAHSPGGSWNYAGCYTDSVSARSLQYGEAVQEGTNAMSIEACMQACDTAGYSIAGTEYGGECWCDNTFKNGATQANDGCTMACKGNTSEICGGSNRLTTYQYTLPPTYPGSSRNSSSSSSVSTYQNTSLSVSSNIPSSTYASTFPSISSSTPTAAPTSSYSNYSSCLPPRSGKRGLAYNNNNPDASAAFSNMFRMYASIAWGYNWGYPSYGLDTIFEFVPLLWGKPGGLTSSYAQTWKAAVQMPGVKNVLGFNEPDLTYGGSANILPASAADGYQTYLEPFRANTSINIGTPNVLWNNDNGYSSGGNYNSRVWTQYFLGNCTGCHFDFAAIHYYQDCNPPSGQDGAAWFKGNVTNAYNTLNLPIWVTEFQCYGTEAQQIGFLQNVLPWLDAQTFVSRYAYFGVFPGYLINANGTGLSALGMTYATT